MPTQYLNDQSWNFVAEFYGNIAHIHAQKPSLLEKYKKRGLKHIGSKGYSHNSFGQPLVFLHLTRSIVMYGFKENSHNLFWQP